MPVEDSAVIATRTEAMADSLLPQDEAEREMTRRAALLALRLERCVEIERENLVKAVTNSVANHDARLRDEVKALAKQLPNRSAEAVRKLRLTAQGVDWLVDQWSTLRESLERNRDLTPSEIDLADHLQGRQENLSSVSSSRALALAIQGDFSHLGLTRPDRSKWEVIKARARLELDKFLEAQIDRLEAHRLTLDHRSAELDRIEAPLRAVVDLSAAGQLLRRYETAAARELHKIFEYFDRIRPRIESEKSTLTLVKPTVSDKLASFRNSVQPPFGSIEKPLKTGGQPPSAFERREGDGDG